MPITFEDLRDALAGQYELERELGRGVGAAVYLAQDLSLPRKVAIKVLDPELALALRSERFVREINTTSRLTHPHIVGLIGAGKANGFLYYVMRYVEGETLGERIERSGPLPLDEALRITREVADALAYAHAQSVIHRDIKPANILLSSGHAWVADFGIARALAGDESVTGTGIQVGTPAYMSPEQWLGATIDERTDLYSLGCVLYEMLSGKAPFEGPLASLRAQHLDSATPSTRSIRTDVPRGIDLIIGRAMAKNPTDRFASANEMITALVEGRVAPRWWPPRRSTVAFASLTAAVVAGGWLARGAWFPPSLVAADSLTHAVLTVDYPDTAAAHRMGTAFHDALAAWRGLTVVEEQAVHERAPVGVALTARQAFSVAKRLRAGRYLRADASPQGDSLRVHVVLYDATRGGQRVGEETARLDLGLRGLESLATRVIDRLLFSDSATAVGTTSYTARSAVEQGLAALGRWDLDGADSAFARAVTDDDYALPHFWLSQVRFARRRPPATWTAAATRARAAQGSLTREQLLLTEGLTAFAAQDLEAACRAFRGAAEQRPDDFVAWYDLGTCLSSDPIVLPDRRSPSGLRFRTSYHAAVQAFRRAYQLLPAILRRHASSGYDEIRRVFLFGVGIRQGRALHAGVFEYASWPTLDRDTLAFVPYPERDVMEARPWTHPERTPAALRRLRSLLHESALTWVAAAPDDPDALEILAVALEMLGDPTCLDTLRHALALARTPDDKLRISGTSVWMQLKFAIPLDLTSLRSARALADSLLGARAASPGSEALLLSGLAALTGHVALTASLYQKAVANLVPGPVARDGPAFLAYAALGGPADSLRALEERVEMRIRQLDSSVQAVNRHAWLARPAALAFPSLRLASVQRLEHTGYRTLDAEAALIRGDTAEARRVLEGIEAARRALMPYNKTLDALYPETDLWAAMNQNERAIAWIDPTLSELSGAPPLSLMDPARAGALVRAMALRAELADRVGDRAASARWSRIVAILWSNADDVLHHVVQRMEELTRR